MNDYRIRIWHRYHEEYPDEPDETITVEADEPYLWQDDPWFDSGPVAFDIHPDDTAATLYIYTNDPVRAPPVGGHIDTGEWDGPVERGLPFGSDYDGPNPFGCEVWGRVCFLVEEGLTR